MGEALQRMLQPQAQPQQAGVPTPYPSSAIPSPTPTANLMSVPGLGMITPEQYQRVSGQVEPSAIQPADIAGGMMSTAGGRATLGKALLDRPVGLSTEDFSWRGAEKLAGGLPLDVVEEAYRDAAKYVMGASKGLKRGSQYVSKVEGILPSEASILQPRTVAHFNPRSNDIRISGTRMGQWTDQMRKGWASGMKKFRATIGHEVQHANDKLLSSNESAYFRELFGGDPQGWNLTERDLQKITSQLDTVGYEGVPWYSDKKLVEQWAKEARAYWRARQLSGEGVLTDNSRAIIKEYEKTFGKIVLP